MIEDVYFRQAELLLRILPFIDKEAVFALKGGTAINFFVRDIPRISVDIDLVYLPIGERDASLKEISSALVRIARDIESRVPGTKVTARKTRESGLLSGLFVQKQETTVKIETNLVLRGSVYPPERRGTSIKEGVPRWRLIGVEGIENLPAVKWKLLNIGRMNPSKHEKAVRKLRAYLGV